MKKRLLSLALCLALCLGLLPVGVLATEGESGGIYVPSGPTEGGGGTYIPGEDTRTEIWRDTSRYQSISRSYDGTTDGSTIKVIFPFTDGSNEIQLEEGKDCEAVKTFDSADAGSRTVTVELKLIGDAATKYKLKEGSEKFTIGGNINKAYPKLTVSLSKTTCAVGEKLLPLLSVDGVQEGAAVTYYYTPIKSGYLEFEGSNAVPKIGENTAISEPGTYYVYAKTGETKNYEEERSTTVELTVSTCDHGGKNGFDGTNCPYCNAPAVAETALNDGEGNRLWRRFADLQTALDADRDGSATLQLLSDVTGDYTIIGTQDTGLDLNGYSIKGTVTVKGTTGDFITTTLSNTKNTTTASIDKVVAHSGAKLGGSGYPAVIGTLTLAEGATWKTILNDTALGYKVLNADGTHKWYAWDDVKGSQLNNVIINRLPITSKNLAFKVKGTSVKGNKVERGTTVQLCASCNANGADVYIYTGEIVGNNVPTYSRKKAEYQKIGTSWYYVVALDANTIGTYDIYFTASKDGYSVTSSHKTLTVTKPNLSNAEITFPNGNEAAFNYVSATGVPTFVVKYNGTELEENVDFVITSGDSTYDVGPCTLTIKATDNGNYTGQKTAEWTVRPLKVAASVGDIIKTYDGTTNLPKDTKITFKSADSYYTGTTLRLAKGTDYEVFNACYDSADASETEKTVSFTIKLKNEGYVFDDGTTQKDFTLNGAELDDKAFKINKAAIASDTQLYQTVFNDLAKTYEIDLKQFLDTILPAGGTYGDIKYGKPSVSMYSDYYPVGGATIGNGKLRLSINKATSIKQGDEIGTVAVQVETTNYQPFTLTIHVIAQDKFAPVMDGTISASEITYGDTLSKSEISGKMKDPNTGDEVKGTFAWTDGTIKPDANDNYEAGWTFTPAEGYEEYAPTTGEVAVKVNPKSIEGAKVALGDSLTYNGSEQTQAVTSVKLDETTLTAGTDYTISGNTGKDAKGYELTISGTGNYTGEVKQAYTIARKAVTATVTVTGSYTYTGKAIEPTFTVEDEGTTIPASEYTVSYENNTNAGTAKIILKDNDVGNYIVSGGAEFTIDKAQATCTPPTANDLTYNGTAQQLFGPGSTQDGTLVYSMHHYGGYVEYGDFCATSAKNYTIWYKVMGDSNHTMSEVNSITVTIKPAPLTVTAKDRSAYVGSAVPTLPTELVENTDYTVTGLFKEDKLTKTPKLSYVATPDMSKVGEFVVNISEADAGSNYTITYVPGKLTITTRSSSSGSSNSGTKTDTVKNPDGSTTKTETKADGSKTETTTASSGGGSTGTTVTKTDAKGNTTTEASAKLSDRDVKEAQEKGEAVTVPVKGIAAAKDANAATKIKIDVPNNANKTTVEIPVENVTSGTVAVIVHEDGTEELVKDSKPTEHGVQLELSGSTTVKIIDNSKTFDDTKGHWSQDDVNFVAARDLFQGVGGNRFGVSEPMTRGMVNTVLARLADVDTTPGQGQAWYEVGTDWAKKNGISDGTNPTAPVTREQLATLLYRYAGSPSVSGTLHAADAASVSDYAEDALLWANQNGIVNGVGSNTIAPKDNAQRAQVAAMLARYLQNQ